ncbi:MAG: DNA polymerase III subunit delta [Pseudomonadota bacterium]
MKLTGAQAAGYADAPDPSRTGVLIYGADAMRVSLKRQALVHALVGPEGDAEMRLTRMPAADLRKDKTAVVDAIKAVGFFPGPRAVVVEDANDQAVDAIRTALEDWGPDDAQIIVTAGQLRPTSKLRKAFEGHANAFAWAIYNDPPTRTEVDAALIKAGLTALAADAEAALFDLSWDLDPGDFTQLVEKLALYTLGQEGPVSATDIDAVAPLSVEAELDDVLHCVAEANTTELAPLLARLSAQGVTATSLCIGMMRHFKTLHRAASHPGGASQGVAALRPPVYGPRRDRLQRQVQGWGRPRLEQALGTILDTDRQLRSAGQTAPQMAVVERALIRLSMMARR